MSFSEKAADAIREAGGRMTAQRQHIIDLLGSASERLDAEGLFEQARVLDPAISLATVYRTLSTLESVGLIRQTYISNVNIMSQSPSPTTSPAGNAIASSASGRTISPSSNMSCKRGLGWAISTCVPASTASARPARLNMRKKPRQKL